jgi:glutamate-5-semialdehyde dehydrogenase
MGNALVREIQHSMRIVVMGHADRLCAIYVDEIAGRGKAKRVVVEAGGYKGHGRVSLSL